MSEDGTGKRSRGDRILLGFVGLLLLAGGVRFVQRWDSSKPGYSEYDYRATRRVLHAVERASSLLQERGTEAFPLFEEPGFKNDDFYIYVYRLQDSECLYHGADPGLVGQAGVHFTDLQGRSVHSSIVAQLDNPQNPHAWVHYLWNRPGEILADWKSSTNREVTLPDGTRVYVGGGLNGAVPEREFARIAVQSAVDLLQRRGSDALEALSDPSGPFNFMESDIFLLGEDGTSIIDPAFRGMESRNVLDYRDASGRYPFRLLFQKLEGSDEAWVPLYGRVAQSMNLQEKRIFAHKASLDGRDVVVGLAMEKPTQIWQK